MKKGIITILALIVSLTIFSQNSDKAKDILDKAYSTYEKSSGIKIEFSFVAEEGKTIQMQQKGTAIVKGNKFKIETNDIETWFDGKTQWVLMKEYNEVNISEPSTEEIASISPTALFGMYKNGYTFGSPVSKTINGRMASQILLTPANNQSEFKNIEVAIDNEKNTIIQVKLVLKNGVSNKIDITSYNTNFRFNDSDFILNIKDYKDAEVIDLR